MGLRAPGTLWQGAIRNCGPAMSTNGTRLETSAQLGVPGSTGDSVECANPPTEIQGVGKGDKISRCSYMTVNVLEMSTKILFPHMTLSYATTIRYLRHDACM